MNPYLMWTLIGVPAYSAMVFGVLSLFPPKTAEEQAAEDAEQMQALAEWRQAHIARQRAMLRGDKRARGVAEAALEPAMSARLKVGI